MFSSSSRNFAGNTSIFLDSLRIIASLTVLYVHACAQWQMPTAADQNGIDWGHVAVVVFFALSGYVIAHTTTGNNRGPSQYAQSRLSRLYAVLLPTLLITAGLEIMVRFLDPALSLHYTRGLSLPRYLMSGLYLNEIWFLSASPPINGPLWSLSFEFWYYVIFGFYFYRTKSLVSILAIFFACLVAGPKILSLMPIWIAGNFAYRIYNPIKSKALSWVIVFGSLLIAVYLVFVLPAYPMKLGIKPMFYAGQFITDFILGIFVAIALWALPGFNNTQVQAKGNKTMVFIRKFADLTFPLYVLHDPLLVLFRSVWPTRNGDGWQMGMAMASVFIVSMVLGHLMEEKRFKWVQFFKWLFSRGELMILKYRTDKQ